jgi:sulfatase modifying factor 1
VRHPIVDVQMLATRDALPRARGGDDVRPSRRDVLATIGLVAATRVVGATAQAPAVFRGARAGEERALDDMRFRWCPAGTFLMGSPPTESGRRTDEAQVSVTLTRGFWMGAFEVTQRDWLRNVGPFPAQPPAADTGVGLDVPVYWVNFAEAEQFAARLTERARRLGALPSGWAVRLPTEAQWEYACRAGTTTATAFGETLSVGQANFEPLATTRGDRSRNRAMPVGSFKPNAWGIADMHGNVFEWCRDWYHAWLPGGVDPDLSDVRGEQNRDGTFSRVRRGGAWMDSAEYCRSAYRLRFEPERRSDHIGFRVAIVETA